MGCIKSSIKIRKENDSVKPSESKDIASPLKNYYASLFLDSKIDKHGVAVLLKIQYETKL